MSIDRKEHHGPWPGAYNNWGRGREAHPRDRNGQGSEEEQESLEYRKQSQESVFYRITTKGQSTPEPRFSSLNNGDSNNCLFHSTAGIKWDKTCKTGL